MDCQGAQGRATRKARRTRGYGTQPHHHTNDCFLFSAKVTNDSGQQQTALLTSAQHTLLDDFQSKLRNLQWHPCTILPSEKKVLMTNNCRRVRRLRHYLSYASARYRSADNEAHVTAFPWPWWAQGALGLGGSPIRGLPWAPQPKAQRL